MALNFLDVRKILFNEPAYLWDGSQKLAGQLQLTPDTLHFSFTNFADSQLTLDLCVDDILEVRAYRLYELIQTGVEIRDEQNRRFIFILKKASVLREHLKSLITRREQ